MLQPKADLAYLRNEDLAQYLETVMNLLADKYKNTVDFELKSTVLVALI